MPYALAGSHIISQTIDDEVVAINLVTGTYYSLRGSAVRVWEVVSGVGSLSEIVSDLVVHYDCGGDRARAEVVKLLDELEAEGLVGSEVGTEREVALNPTGEAPFEPPILERFDDMQELLLLDPVHEVSEEEGWPARMEVAPPSSETHA